LIREVCCDDGRFPPELLDLVVCFLVAFISLIVRISIRHPLPLMRGVAPLT
jgi:hypothetical protein